MAKFEGTGYLIKEDTDEICFFFIGTEKEAIDQIKALNTEYKGSEYYICENNLPYYISNNLSMIWKVK
jgi:hypothetical protein